MGEFLFMLANESKEEVAYSRLFQSIIFTVIIVSAIYFETTSAYAIMFSVRDAYRQWSSRGGQD